MASQGLRVVALDTVVPRNSHGQMCDARLAWLARTLAMTVPSTAHQIVLDLAPGAPPAWRLEPPGYAVHAWLDGALVSHVVALGDHGPVGLY